MALDDTRQRRTLRLFDLIGIQRLTGLSHAGIGVDGTYYRLGRDPARRAKIPYYLEEVFDDEIVELEHAIVVHRMDRIVAFVPEFNPPMVEPWLHVVDEASGLLLAGIGEHRSTTNEWFIAKSGRRRTRWIDTFGFYFRYNLKGYELEADSKRIAFKDP